MHRLIVYIGEGVEIVKTRTHVSSPIFGTGNFAEKMLPQHEVDKIGQVFALFVRQKS